MEQKKDRKLKIIHFIHGLNMGGAETLVKDYCLGLDRSRFDVTLLCTYRYGTPYEQVLHDAGVRVVYAQDASVWTERAENAKGFKRKLLKGLWHADLYRIIRRFLRTEQPDVIHAHLNVCTYLKFAKPQRPVKLLYTVHNEPSRVWDPKVRFKRLDEKACRWLIRHFGMKLIVLHEQMREEISQMYGIPGSGCQVIRNGIDFSRYDSPVDTAAKKRELDVPENAFVVGHVGRLSIAKNHEFLLRVFQEMAVLRPDAHLVMIGNGEREPLIRQKIEESGISERIHLISNRTDVPQLYRIMNIFLFPSTFEGMPVTLIEAQKAGTRCLVSDRVTQEAKLSNLVRYESLSFTPRQWAEDALSFASETITPEYHGMEDWDIHNVLAKLAELYVSGETD